MDSWVTLFFMAASSVLLGVGIMRARTEQFPLLLNYLCISFGLLGTLGNGLVIAHKLGLI